MCINDFDSFKYVMLSIWFIAHGKHGEHDKKCIVDEK